MRAKVIGCLIGLALGSIQLKAWAYPIGYEEFEAYGQGIIDPEEYMEERLIDITDEVTQSCEKWGAEYNICPEDGEALCYVETRCTDATNGNCEGIAQINVPYHRARMKRLGITDIHNTDQNIHVMFDYLSELYGKYGDLAKALDAYNGNGKNGKSGYAKDILTVAAVLDMLE